MSQIRPATETRHRLSGRRRPLGVIFDARWRHDALRAVAAPLLFGLRLWASVCLALRVAFWLELDNAYWAGTSAAIVCQPHLGASLRKGRYRRHHEHDQHDGDVRTSFAVLACMKVTPPAETGSPCSRRVSRTAPTAASGTGFRAVRLGSRLPARALVAAAPDRCYPPKRPGPWRGPGSRPARA